MFSMGRSLPYEGIYYCDGDFSNVRVTLEDMGIEN
jgi:hypothetical protein